ncbi:MAG: hypothetical protein M3275_12855, partial [Thermoproteota archaeon]|nr:hypothetical protein [Thermoproteota archaeon]
MRIESEDNESVMKWFDEEVREGENSILVYPNLQTFRRIYTKYAKDQLAAKAGDEQEDDDDNNNNNSRRNKQSKSRIILIAPFYETVDSVK